MKYNKELTFCIYNVNGQSNLFISFIHIKLKVSLVGISITIVNNTIANTIFNLLNR